MSAMVPVPRSSIAVRPAIPPDAAFIDALQKLHTKMVGWFPTKQIEGKIAAGQVLIAENEGEDPVGYCIAHDRYMGRDDVGVVYQLNVAPLKQRNLIGATLIRATFERAAYGCRLFCLWCAQDLDANHFWESIGFIPLAFRTGSRGKRRMHIFWQRRIRDDDMTTPYWFPSQTKSGAIREDRLVFPIPPGVHWRDAMPVVLPGATGQPALPPTNEMERRRVKPPPRAGAGNPMNIASGGLRFVVPGEEKSSTAGKRPRAPRAPAAKHDKKQVAAARELRDRYLEQMNAVADAHPQVGKYNVSRHVESREPAAVQALPPLPAMLAAVAA